jgi:hypothetical protein
VLASDSVEGQRYLLPKRIGIDIVGIQTGWNHSGQYLLFLLERGEERVLKIILPTEEIKAL